MPMPVLDSIQAALAAVSHFLITEGAALPSDLRDALIESSGRPSPVDRIVEVGETLYANASLLSDDGKLLCAALVSFATLNGWHGLAEDNRGGRMAMAMRRETGEEPPAGLTWPDAESDPAPKGAPVVADAEG
ncbi:hypothetical protein [Sphingobium agri]|uniref:Uncharacterized protein n=1 Tax=Sphingobium agri TaxID=2933566 RepID=A0ABT0DWE8_9SPHN|nr:hypothetical protein [Sphingobium agri]MCK0531443.1 hypothetical protein [Sphingobium agri]